MEVEDDVTEHFRIGERKLQIKLEEKDMIISETAAALAEKEAALSEKDALLAELAALKARIQTGEK
jgi:hypothetical protein